MPNPIDVQNQEWSFWNTKTVTFILTEDCQLACKYCYLVGKNKKGKMSFDIARRTIDLIMKDSLLYESDSIIFNFIGGEPFLEIDLIEKISNYFKIKAYKEKHPWFDSYRFSFTTNGLNYHNDKVQTYIKQNIFHLSIGITIDGTKEKHDLNRVFPNEKGSYNLVLSNIPLWLSQFPKAATKVTVSSDDLPYLKDSILHLWSLGIKKINSNVVFEDVWKEGDDHILKEQLISLADEIIKKDLYPTFNCSFFSRTIGQPKPENQNWCGAGSMIAVDHRGDFYPCIRFAPFSLQNRDARIVGNCFDGINHNRIRPFLTLDLVSQSNEECVNCEVATGCAWCQGVNYDCADSNTIYQRITYICKMHKARVEANQYFWSKLDSINK